MLLPDRDSNERTLKLSLFCKFSLKATEFRRLSPHVVRLSTVGKAHRAETRANRVLKKGTVPFFNGLLTDIFPTFYQNLTGTPDGRKD